MKFLGRESLIADDRSEQSGAYMNGLWKKTLKTLPKSFCPQTITFFGIGHGGGLHVAAKTFPHARITGIEWDPTLLALAQKNLSPYSNISLIHADAEIWAPTMPQTNLSLVDLFVGERLAPCMYNPAFLPHIIEQSSVTIVNAYYHQDILNKVADLTAPTPARRLQYYASSIGIYGSPDVRT